MLCIIVLVDFTCTTTFGWQVNNYDLVGALDLLAQLEAEQTSQRKQFLQVEHPAIADGLYSLSTGLAFCLKALLSAERKGKKILLH